MSKIEMDVTIKVIGDIDHKELSRDLDGYGCTITPLPGAVQIDVRIDVVNDAIEHIMAVCHKYGDHEVTAKRVGL